MLSVVLITLAVVSVVSAFGVSSPYWEGNPLTLARGDTTVVNLNLQNMVGDEDVRVQAELKGGSDITSLSEEIYVVAAKTSDTMVPLVIEMPEDAIPGEVRSVSVDFKTIAGDTGGIAMGTGMVISFEVIAAEAVEDGDMVPANLIVGLIVGLIVLALIFWILLKNKKK